MLVEDKLSPFKGRSHFDKAITIDAKQRNEYHKCWENRRGSILNGILNAERNQKLRNVS